MFAKARYPDDEACSEALEDGRLVRSPHLVLAPPELGLGVGSVRYKEFSEYTIENKKQFSDTIFRYLSFASFEKLDIMDANSWLAHSDSDRIK